MHRTTALIIDDERLARVAVRKKLEKFPEIEVIGEASGIETAVRAIADLNPDLLFLDIQLSDGSGFDLLNRINYTGKVIFITAYDKYAIRAFDINALDYLLKPVSQKRLKEAIQKLHVAENKTGSNEQVRFDYDDRLMFMVKSRMYFIRIDSITCVSASGDYTSVHTTDGKKLLSLRSMHEWEQSLPGNNFARIHRSWIINFNHINSTEKSGVTGKVQMSGMSEPLEISRSYMKVLKSKYKF